jgi:hypothetical protein
MTAKEMLAQLREQIAALEAQTISDLNVFGQEVKSAVSELSPPELPVTFSVTISEDGSVSVTFGQVRLLSKTPTGKPASETFAQYKLGTSFTKVHKGRAISGVKVGDNIIQTQDGFQGSPSAAAKHALGVSYEINGPAWWTTGSEIRQPV